MSPESSLHSPLKIGVILFPGFELIDVFGPLEMFGLLGEKASIITLAEKPGLVAARGGPRVLEEFSLAEVGWLDVFLVPGGSGSRQEVANLPFLELLRQSADRAGIVASVCTGSALLARAGILNGRKATSNKIAWDWVVAQGPEVLWMRKARWVEDGNIFTSSGISAGMDMTLALIARVLGRSSAEAIARQAEYLWNEDSAADPFANGIE